MQRHNLIAWMAGGILATGLITAYVLTVLMEPVVLTSYVAKGNS